MNTPQYTTRQLLTELALPYWTLHAALRAGHIPSPGSKLGTGYLWTQAEWDVARRYFQERDGKLNT